MILLERVQSESGEILVLQTSRHRSVVYQQGGFCQSEADQHGVSLASYIHAIFGLLAQALPKDVLMIGCGGGSLGTMLSRLGVRVTIVDTNPEAFDIARRYFNLPDEIQCYVGDGRQFLLSDTHRYDAIILDAYIGSDLPAHLRSRSLFRLAKRRIADDDGCVFANVYTQHDLDRAPDAAATEMAAAWDQVRVLDIRGITSRNAIVMAGRVRDLVKPKLLLAPESGTDEILYDLDRWAFRPWRDHNR